MNRPDVLALIPARGGSKSVPRKNLLNLLGKPLIQYSIEHALGCPEITRTLVSTDDLEIADVAQRVGAEVPFLRPAEFATDTATDRMVFRHALEWLYQNQGYRPQLVVHLRPTGPVREVEVISRAVQLMLGHPEADSLRSVSLAEQTPYKMWRISGATMEPALPLPGYPESHSMPRQELPPVYWQNGYVDVVRPRTVLELDSMVGGVVLPLVLEHLPPDLDYPDQIPAIEEALEAQRGSGAGSSFSRGMRHPH